MHISLSSPGIDEMFLVTCSNMPFSKLREVCVDFEAELIACNSESDHVHLLVECNPKVQVTKLVNSLKAVTSRRMRAEFNDLKGAYSKPVLWGRSFFVGSCGVAPREVAGQYIQTQRG